MTNITDFTEFTDLSHPPLFMDEYYRDCWAKTELSTLL